MRSQILIIHFLFSGMFNAGRSILINISLRVCAPVQAIFQFRKSLDRTDPAGSFASCRIERGRLFETGIYRNRKAKIIERVGGKL